MTDLTGLDEVPGWLGPSDRRLMEWFLAEQVASGRRGDLAELGVYFGKSAIVIGAWRQDGETFTIVDTFDEEPADPANAAENEQQYAGLTQQAFERSYLRFHDRLPAIVRGESQTVVDHAAAGAHRFVHIDASHHYDQVRADIAATRTLLAPDGVVVFDDIRSVHTPGVAAAVWEEVVTGGLKPIVISERKLYATYADPGPWVERLTAWLPSSPFRHEIQQVLGRPLVRVWAPVIPPPMWKRVRDLVLPPGVAALLRRLRRRVRAGR
jgi:predicted O-methyltransferase YrrM